MLELPEPFPVQSSPISFICRETRAFMKMSMVRDQIYFSAAKRFRPRWFHRHCVLIWCNILIAFFLCDISWTAEPQPSEGDLEFFESKVRPLLKEHCGECHSSTKGDPEGGLSFDTRGDFRSAEGVVVSGEPDASLLIRAIRYDDSELQMPPDGKLSNEAIVTLEEWVRRGLPWTDDGSATASKNVFDIAQRKAAHWCWQPITRKAPPQVAHTEWARSDIDRFVLSKLEAVGLTPAPEADVATLARRASAWLIGMPPDPRAIDSLLADSDPNAFEKYVDSLLASPHFGERFGRHWLDVVRYAETRGHEFDNPIPNAWRYRDWVIEALNNDLPYDQFVREQVAGDLVPVARQDATGANRSVVGTGFWFLGEEVHSPVDIAQDEADRIDNRVDTFGKAFLGLAMGCARCHDHKFDAISNEDYYAISGMLMSSGYRQVPFESLEHNRAVATDLLENSAMARRQLLPLVGERLEAAIESFTVLLPIAVDLVAHDEQKEPLEASTKATAEALNVHQADLSRLVMLVSNAKKDLSHPLHQAVNLCGASGVIQADQAFDAFIGLVQSNESPRYCAKSSNDSPFKIVADYALDGLKTPIWSDAFAWGLAAVPAGQPMPITQSPFVQILRSTEIRSEAIWAKGKSTAQRDPAPLGEFDRAGKVLRSPKITLASPSLWYLIKGHLQIFAAVDSHVMVAGPLHGRTILSVDTKGQWKWHRHDLSPYVGHRVHVEFASREGESAVAAVIDAQDEPKTIDPLALLLVSQCWQASGDFTGEGHTNSFRPDSSAVCASLSKLLVEATKACRAGTLAEHPTASGLAPLVSSVLESEIGTVPVLTPTTMSLMDRLREQASSIHGLREQTLLRAKLESATAPAILDGNGIEQAVLIKGSAARRGDMVPRRFLEAIDGPSQRPWPTDSSGRMELVDRVLDPANPLTMRVAVNRIWQHLCGRGLVPTPDNFGVLGEASSHPELLDFLAIRFRDEGMSIKKIVREIVTSSTWRMSSVPDLKALSMDPTNKLLHHSTIRRLEGEAVRDSMLAVSGRLNPLVGGPPVEVYLTDFMHGRGRPSSGPLDGDGRRSIYTSIRRNFLPSFMVAFDMPNPFQAMGRRNVTNVPAQALVLMNDPLVASLAKTWAEKTILEESQTPRERIESMYLRAFSRKPQLNEMDDAKVFLVEQAQMHGIDFEKNPRDLAAWTDLAHALFNTKEFIFIP